MPESPAQQSPFESGALAMANALLIDARQVLLVTRDGMDNAPDKWTENQRNVLARRAPFLAREVLRLHEPDDALVEQVAQALAIQVDGESDWDSMTEPLRDLYRADARAALAALRGTS